ncbi:MAG TPA: tetratricopeptide repeat protein, partial [Gemmataceae bacterium]
LGPVVLKILAGLQDDADNANVFFYFDAPFWIAEQYFAEVLAAFESELDELADALAAAGAAAPPPGGDDRAPVADRLARRVDAAAGALPEHAGSLVLILHPRDVGSPARFAAALGGLAERARCPRTKFLLLDAGDSPEIDRLRRSGERYGGQDFRLSPEVIEEQVHADLESGDLSPAERRQYLAMAGAFAFAKGEVERALELRTEVARSAAREGGPSDLAVALYDLGNTHLKANDPAAAERSFTRAAEACMEAGNDPLLAVVLLNLGVALHRQGKAEAALRSFDAGRQTFRALGLLAGEVHALDTRAAALAEAGDRPGAEQAWQEAIRLTEEIESPDFAELRQSCRDDLTDKLRRFRESAATPPATPTTPEPALP